MNRVKGAITEEKRERIRERYDNVEEKVALDIFAF